MSFISSSFIVKVVNFTAAIFLSLPIFIPLKSNAVTHNWFGGSTCLTAIESYNQNVNLTVSPGDTIIIKRFYTLINWANVNGTKVNPIVIMVDSGVQIGCNTANGYGMVVQGHHFKLYGDTVNTTGYSMTALIQNSRDSLMNSGLGFGTSYEFLATGFHIVKAKAGIFFNPSTGGRKPNITISNMAIEDMQSGLPSGQGTAEAIYIGSTGLIDTSQTYYDSMLVENIRAKDLDGDGIQIAVTRNLILRNCTVTNFGRKNINAQRSAYLFGGMTQGSAYNLTATTGTGTYMMFFGGGLCTLDNFNFSGGATSSGEAGIYINKKGALLEGVTVVLTNGTINGAAAAGIRDDNSISTTLCNVAISNFGTSEKTGSHYIISTACINDSRNNIRSGRVPIRSGTVIVQ